MADMQRTALLSSDGMFRYLLGRRWADGAPLLFIMLNPSTADARVDDASIRRCIKFAQAHSYPALEVVNLYAFRATDPRELKRAGYPVGPDNDQHITAAVTQAAAVCVAWGANAAGLERPLVVLSMLDALHVRPACLGVTSSGHPAHPLMLPAASRLVYFDAARLRAASAGIGAASTLPGVKP